MPPVFLLNRLLPAAEQTAYTTAELCAAAERVCGHRTIEGAQRIGGLWRVYPKTTESRVALLTQGLEVRGVCVSPRDKNPFLIRDENGQEKENPAVKLFVGGVLLSHKNSDIITALEKIGV